MIISDNANELNAALFDLLNSEHRGSPEPHALAPVAVQLPVPAVLAPARRRSHVSVAALILLLLLPAALILILYFAKPSNVSRSEGLFLDGTEIRILAG